MKRKNIDVLIFFILSILIVIADTWLGLQVAAFIGADPGKIIFDTVIISLLVWGALWLEMVKRKKK